jgi:hypothetical protein
MTFGFERVCVAVQRVRSAVAMLATAGALDTLCEHPRGQSVRLNLEWQGWS